jgi:2-phosphosulfolactate phosphatase
VASSPDATRDEIPVTTQPPAEHPEAQPTRPPAGESPGAFFEWGAAGAQALAATCSAIVVVDVLSFTTTVAVAAGLGTEVIPCGDLATGRRLAGDTGAQLAVRRHETDEEHPWSLSPASVAAAPRVARLVVESPNGAAISAAVAQKGVPVVAACLRNISAVVGWLVVRGYGEPSKPIAVVAAGERWADGSLRPAIEDLFGGGLVLAGLADAGVVLSPEASVAVRSVRGLPPPQLAALVRASTSGTELRVGGYEADVEIAIEIDADDVVPVMIGAMAGFRDQMIRGEAR